MLGWVVGRALMGMVVGSIPGGGIFLLDSFPSGPQADG